MTNMTAAAPFAGDKGGEQTLKPLHGRAVQRRLIARPNGAIGRVLVGEAGTCLDEYVDAGTAVIGTACGIGIDLEHDEPRVPRNQPGSPGDLERAQY